uniref:Uncharacterized protein n=1 Tax=Siphoviridae sp. ctVif31 TaxID=2825532 RepID=A0A8S5Q3P9_9CAUD|nr:MAG TPA: hypothetical protein [Siphoviridae sp. ctVif31]
MVRAVPVVCFLCSFVDIIIPYIRHKNNRHSIQI